MSGYHKYVRLKMDGLLKPWQKCVLICMCDVCCTSVSPLPVGKGVWSMCYTMKTGRYGAWLSTVVGQMLTSSGANVKMVVVTMLRSDVFHLLHMWHVLISHNNILT